MHRLLGRGWFGVAVALSIMLAGRSVHAQTGKITGTVRDAETGQPIEGIAVQLEGTGIGAMTNTTGRYFILSVPPGTYTVTARRLGYQSSSVRSVRLGVDQTQEVNFSLSSAAGQLAAVKVAEQEERLIPPGTTGSRSQINADEIDAMPTTSIAGVLALQLGFLQVPVENTDVTAFVDERRGVTSLRIRGGRAGETQTLIDNIPINNFVLGGPSFEPTPEAVSQIDYQRGGLEAQYGNAMSGVINLVTKEGTPELKGSLKYSTSRVAGQLGSIADSMRGADLVEGSLSGPVPLTGQRMRWFAAARQSTGAHRVLEFDNYIYDPFNNAADSRGNVANARDFKKGWQPVGFRAQRDVFGKLTTLFTPTMKLSIGGIDYERQYQDYNPAFVLSGFDVVEACVDAYPSARDYCERNYGPGRPTRFEDLQFGANSVNNLKYVSQGSTRTRRNLGWAKFSHTIGRTNYQVAAGRLYVARNACNYLTGLCLGDKIRNYTTSQSFVIPRTIANSSVNAPYVNPGTGGENFAGGDTNTTVSFRADLQSQVTDHHNVQGGVFYQHHDIRFYEARNLSRPFDASVVGNYTYGGKPWDAAVYIQDKLEYDFLTLKVGFRFDYTRASGQFFRNPLDPTNGTTVFEVCEGKAFGSTPYTFTLPDGRVITGLGACNQDPALMDQAREIAFQDDFGPAPVRKQFSPRVSLNFPISERTSFFMNWGIYSQNPLYNAMYQGTGIGRTADSATFNTVTRDTIRKGTSLEGTPAGPNFRQDFSNVPIIGNPHLEIEKTSAYEMGFLAEIGSQYSLSVTGYTKDQSGLAGFRRGGVRTDGTPVDDKGETYSKGAILYNILVNTDYQTVRGVEAMFKRRINNFWGYDLRYGYQQIFTNAAPPDLEIQKIIERDVAVSREIRSEITQPHLFNSVLRFEVGALAPSFRYGSALRNSRLTLTSNFASGLPYTPCRTFVCGPNDRGERNSGTAPPTWTVDMLAEKRLKVGNLSYGLYLTVTNLLDRPNCLQVYPTTGQCDAGSLNTYRSIVGPYQNGGVDENAIGQQNVNTTQFDHPELFSERRTIMTGIRLSF
jgi:hypothetical protein